MPFSLFSPFPLFPPFPQGRGDKKESKFFEEGVKKPGALFGKGENPGAFNKRGQRESSCAFNKRGKWRIRQEQKAPFDAEGIKGGVCAADGGIKKIRAKKGEKSAPPALYDGGEFPNANNFEFSSKID